MTDPGATGRRLHPALGWGVGALVAAVLLWIIVRSVERDAFATQVANAHPGWLGAAVLLNLTILLLWAGLWVILSPAERSPGYRPMLAIAAASSTIMNTVPMLVGHATALALLATRTRLGVAGAVTVIALDQVAEAITKAGVVAVALMTAPIPPWIHQGVRPAGWSAALVIAVAAGAAWVGRRHLAHMRSGARIAAALVVAAAMKVVEAGAIHLVMRACGVDLPFTSAFVVLAATNLATMLPLAPANLGAYEVSAMAAYRWLGVEPGLAATTAIVQHVCFLVPAIGLGCILGMQLLRPGFRSSGSSAAP